MENAVISIEILQVIEVELLHVADDDAGELLVRDVGAKHGWLKGSTGRGSTVLNDTSVCIALHSLGMAEAVAARSASAEKACIVVMRGVGTGGGCFGHGRCRFRVEKKSEPSASGDRTRPAAGRSTARGGDSWVKHARTGTTWLFAAKP